jgi:hypothetical protein
MKDYNTTYNTNQSILTAEKNIERLHAVNEQLGKELEVFDKLNTSLDETAKIMMPTLREYVEGVRGLRMAFSTEVKHIIDSSMELNKLGKDVEKLKELAALVTMLSDILGKGHLNERIKEIFNV